MFLITTALKKIRSLDKRIHGIQGGTSASKTISIIQILIDKAQRDKTPTLTSITSETMPHLKKGAMRDFLNMMQEHKYFVDELWNKSEYTYTFETGSKIEFFSLDMPHKVRGPRRQRLFINEANSIPYETFDQLEVRTEDEIWLDWNPVSEFWWHVGEKDRPPVRERYDADELILTYLDNEGLPESIRKSVESRKSNASWWRVYGMGLLGEAEGRIYKGWEFIDEIPLGARLEGYGLDFGYTNDPTAIISIYRYNNGFILNEEIYMSGLSNKQIADIMLNKPRALIIADSAEPKSIDEIKGYGISIIPSMKGRGSVNQGIQYVQDQQITVTKGSLNLIREYRNYLWQLDSRTGKVINDPSPINNHAMDAIRYGLSKYFVDDTPKYNPPNTEKLAEMGKGAYGGVGWGAYGLSDERL